VTKEPEKGTGQLSGINSSFGSLVHQPESLLELDPSEEASISKSTKADTERGEKKAENMRYGQAISEQGVGGFTDPEYNSGGADQEEGKIGGQGRREQGYDAGREMDRGIGG
jgi:hypothetical protein